VTTASLHALGIGFALLMTRVHLRPVIRGAALACVLPGAGLFGAQALTLIRKPHPLGRLVAQALPQSWNCKIKEGSQLQRDLTLARVDNADRPWRWLIRLQQSD
jgi:hypothetical protein